MRRNTAGGAKKIALSAVKTLTFYADKYTAGRRTNPIPQLTCKGPGCKVFQPDVVQCTNMGDDGLGNVQWKCDTDLPSSLRLGKVDVSCEGWSAPGDPNILQGSCGLTYNLYKGAGRRWTRVWRRSSSPSSLYQTRPRPHPRPRSHPRPHPATATNPSRSRYMVEPRFLDWSRPRRIWRLAR
ncbi:hypothetical protein C343_06704 [Cryptococcus neoformans C23]|nr:hypothetical protein C343_06704 [Cryptococcus neoformans var. grubii C23]